MISPEFRMAMRWQSAATESRSWDIYRMPMPSSRLRRANRLRISDWVMVSRALVDSSAMRSEGR